MKKASFILIVLVTLTLSACVHKNLITPSQSRVGYSAWNTQVSYTHCDPHTIQCTARKDVGPEGFIIVFNYVDAQHYCQLNYGYEGNTKHAIEQISGNKRKQLTTHPGSVETGKWYDVKLTVASDTIKAWLNNELIFDEILNVK